MRNAAWLALSVLVAVSPASAASETDALLRSTFDEVIATRSESVVPPYLAIANEPTRWFARAACDDDGDNVIVVSRGAVSLVRDLSRASRIANSTVTYRELLVRNAAPGLSALPPPVGFFGEGVDAETERARARSMFAYVLAYELARFEAGEPRCIHPDRLREHGDDVWTANEQVSLDYHQQITADSPEASEETLLSHMNAKRDGLGGAIDLLAFFAEIEPFAGTDRLLRATARDARARAARLRTHDAPKKDVRMAPLRR